MVRPREQDSSSNHLPHDAAHGPYVHVLGVPHAEYDLGSPVVPRHHVRGHHERGPGRASQPEVQDLESAVALHHYVGRLQVLGGAHYKGFNETDL